MIKMKLNTLLRGVSLLCIAAVGVSALTGCGGPPPRMGNAELDKDMPDMGHLKVKPGEAKPMAIKRAFRDSAPGIGE